MPPDVSKNRDLSGSVATIILAGGQGTRLFPLTQHRCKPAVSFGGHYRLIDIPISNALNAQIHRIFVISQYLASSLHEHIVETYPLDPFRALKIQLLSPEETPEHKTWYKGTADAVRQNLLHLESAPVDYFLILSGDQLYNMDFTDLITFAKQQDADLTIASIPVEQQEAKRMGLLKVNASHQIEEFYEKPSDPTLLSRFSLSQGALNGHDILHPEKTHYLASMGIYVFKRAALFQLLEEKGDDFGKDLIPIQIKKGKAAAYVYKGYWEDIGTVASYYQANLALIDQNHCLNTYDEFNPIFTHPHHLPSPMIKGTLIERALIGQGSVIAAQEIKNSVVGIRVNIKKGTVIHDSVIMGNLYYDAPHHHHLPLPKEFSIGKNCRIQKAIIDEHTCIGNNVQLTNVKKLKNWDGDGIYIRDGIIIVTTGTKVPDGFIL
ncbi:MAG: NTP transferase domain-containing protein [Verrucomicrobia bacterium]|nr:NTP transferase domain-containing protein [Verrucomicrobiota bacterium]